MGQAAGFGCMVRYCCSSTAACLQRFRLLPSLHFCHTLRMYTDQTMLSSALHNWRHFPDDVELVARNPARDRIDRMMWRVPAGKEELGRCVGWAAWGLGFVV